MDSKDKEQPSDREVHSDDVSVPTDREVHSDDVSVPTDREVHSDDVSVSSDKEIHSDDLDWLSDRLDRAIRGIFVLTFQKLPKWIGNALTSVFSTIFNFIWKVIQEATYFLQKAFIWLFWTLPRQVIGWFVESANYLLRLGGVFVKVLTLLTVVFGPLLISLNTGLFLVGAIIWCLIAIVGAIWGLIYLNRSKWKIGQTIGRLANKLKFWQQGSVPEVAEK
jgi:hypothetical protein